MQNTAELFGNNLKTLRKNAGLTQKGLAEKLGISEKSISKWEVGAAITPNSLYLFQLNVWDIERRHKFRMSD